MCGTLLPLLWRFGTLENMTTDWIKVNKKHLKQKYVSAEMCDTFSH